MGAVTSTCAACSYRCVACPRSWMSRPFAVVTQALSPPRRPGFSVLQNTNLGLGVKATSADPPLRTDGQSDRHLYMMCRTSYRIPSYYNFATFKIIVFHVRLCISHAVNSSLSNVQTLQVESEISDGIKLFIRFYKATQSA